MLGTQKRGPVCGMRAALSRRCGAPKPQRRAQRRPRGKLGYKPVHIVTGTLVCRESFTMIHQQRGMPGAGDVVLVGLELGGSPGAILTDDVRRPAPLPECRRGPVRGASSSWSLRQNRDYTP